MHGARPSVSCAAETHLNGNAVYNVSHECFRLVLEKMEEENSGTEAFDVATRRIIREFYPMCEDAYKQTTAIDNLAATLVLPDETNQNTSYIHGAKIMRPVRGTTTALVSGSHRQDSALKGGVRKDGVPPRSLRRGLLVLGARPARR